MGLLIDNNYHISWLFIGVLIGLSVENVFLTMRCTFINLCFQNFLFFHHFFTIAALALVGFIDLLSRTAAVGTWACALRVHSWTNHSHLSSHSSSLAASAC